MPRKKIETVELPPEPVNDLCCGNGCCTPPEPTRTAVEDIQALYPNATVVDIDDIHCDCAIEFVDEWTTEDLESGLTKILEELDKRGELGVRFVGRDGDIVANVVLEHAEAVIADVKAVTPVKTILDEAAEIVSGARRKAYGHPENNFGRISALWNAYLSGKPDGALPITNTDVSLLMILMKVARLIESPDHRDSLVDLAGYAATVEMLWNKA